MTQQELNLKNENLINIAESEDGKNILISKNICKFLKGKIITDRTEIAKNVNFTNRPTIYFDLDNLKSYLWYDEAEKLNETYSINGSKVKWESETRGHKCWRYGYTFYSYEKRANEDAKLEICVMENVCCLHESFNAYDVKEMADNATAPVIADGKKVNILFYSRKFSEYGYNGLVVGTIKMTNIRNCTQVAKIEL